MGKRKENMHVDTGAKKALFDFITGTGSEATRLLVNEDFSDTRVITEV